MVQGGDVNAESLAVGTASQAIKKFGACCQLSRQELKGNEKQIKSVCQPRDRRRC
jgi:hypothetical protein